MSLEHQIILVAVLFLVFATLSFIARGQRLVLTRRLKSHRKRKKLSNIDNINTDPTISNEANGDEDNESIEEDEIPKAEQIRKRNLNLTLLLIAISLALGIGIAIWSKGA